MVHPDSSGYVEWANGGPAKYFHKRRYIDMRPHYGMLVMEIKDITIVSIKSDEMKSGVLT